MLRLTRDALTMLSAQYRSVLKNAWFKLMTAGTINKKVKTAVLTAGLTQMAAVLASPQGAALPALSPVNLNSVSSFNDIEQGDRAVIAYKDGQFYIKNKAQVHQAVSSDIMDALSSYQNQHLTSEQLGQAASVLERTLTLKGYQGINAAFEPGFGGAESIITLSFSGIGKKQADPAVISAALRGSLKSQENDHLSGLLSSTASAVQGAVAAEDKEQWAMSTAKGYAENAVNTAVNDAVGQLGDNIKSQIRLTYDEDDREVRPTGRLLVPVVDHAQYTVFGQTVLNEAPNDRFVGFLGGGVRVYPNAETVMDRGDWGWGVNAFYGHDFTRGHRRLSVGGEFLFNTGKVYGNAYQRLSGWRDSEDFDSYLVEERPANGWDIGLEYALPMYTPLKFRAEYAKWYGDNVAVGGDTDNLQHNPDVYELGVDYQVLNAVGLRYTYQRTNDGIDNQFGLNFNVPLDSEGLKHAFEPAQSGSVNTIDQSPYQFVSFDEDFTLEYREQAGHYAISYLGPKGGNQHHFAISTGLDGHTAYASVKVTPDDSGILMSNAGSYITDAAGQFTAQIQSTLGAAQQPVESVPVTVTVGETSKRFNLAVAPENFGIELSAQAIRDDEEATVLIRGGAGASYRITTSFEQASASGRAGTGGKPFALAWNGTVLSDGDTVQADENGLVEMIFDPDVEASLDYTAAITVLSEATGETQSVDIIVGKSVDINWDDILGDGSLVWGDSNHNGIPDIELDISGGKPGESIIIKGDDADKVVLIPEDAKFDEDGNAHIVIEQKPDGAGNSGNTSIEIDAGSGGSHEVVITNPTFNPTVTIPEVEYGQSFPIIIEGAKPNSDIYFKPDSDGNVPSPNPARADGKGNVTITYPPINDYQEDGRGSITIEIAASATGDETKEITVEFDIKDPDQNWSDMLPDDSFVFGDADSDGRGDVTITVEGGIEGQPIIVEGQDGDRVTVTDPEGNTPPKFGPDGSAEIVIEENEPNSGNIIVNVGDGKGHGTDITITPHDFAPEITLPAEVTYGEDITVLVKGTAPGSTVEFKPIEGVTAADTPSVTADEYGNASAVYSGVTDYTQSALDLHIVYQSDADGGRTEVTKTVNIADLNLSFGAPSLEYIIDVAQPVTFTLSGGVSGEAVEWSVSGHGTVDAEHSDSAFGADGTATVSIMPAEPYVDVVSVSARTMARNVFSTAVYYDLPDLELNADYSGLNFKGQPMTIDYQTPFSIPVSNLTPNTVIKLDADANHAKPIETEITVGPDGTAVLQFAGVDDYSVDEIVITGTYQTTASEQSTVQWRSEPIKLYQWGADGTGAQFDPSLGGGNELKEGGTLTIPFKGGRPNTEITFTVTDGSAQISGSSGDKTVTVTTDADGNADVTIEPAAPYDESAAIVIKAEHCGNTMTADDIRLVLQHYSADDLQSMVSPLVSGQLEYDTPYTVTVTGLVPNSQVQWLTDGDVKPDQSSSTADDEGKASMTYAGISNYAIAQVDGIKLKFAQTIAEQDNPQGELTLQPVALHKYVPELTVEGGNAFTEGQRKTVKLSGGKEGVEVRWSSNNTMFTLSGSTSTFNAQGVAEVEVTAQVPDTVTESDLEAIAGAITAKTVLGGEQIKTADVSVTLSAYSPVVSVADPYDGIYVNDSTHVKDKASTIDFDTAWSLQVTDARPGTMIKIISSGDAQADAGEYAVQDDGTAELTFKSISSTAHADLNGKSITVQYEYYDRANHKTTGSKTVNLVNYSVELKSDKEVIIGNETFTITASGGKPGAKVEWSVEGNGSITSKDAVFDDQGNAEAIVKGVEPYSGTVTVEIKGIATTSKLIKLHPFIVEDMSPNRKCQSDSFDHCSIQGSYYRGGDHGFKITGVPGTKINVKIRINNIQIGEGGTTAADDTDFNADVSFIYDGEELYKFENIFFDNSVYKTAGKTEFSVLMFFDENSQKQGVYDEILMTSDITYAGDQFDFDFTLPSNDSSVGMSFTRREPL